jgi:alpha-amylase
MQSVQCGNARAPNFFLAFFLRLYYHRGMRGKKTIQGQCDVILQAFHWNLVKTQGTGTLEPHSQSWYGILLTTLDRIAATGFTILLLPPPWRDDSAWEYAGKHGGGEGYCWHDFSLDTRYGTREELCALVAAAHERGMKVLVELPFDHRDAANMQADIWPNPGPAWRANAGNPNTLALDSSLVRKRVVRALDELVKDCRIDGWRWKTSSAYEPRDLAKWYKLIKNKKFISIVNYWESLVRNPVHEPQRIVNWMKKIGGMAVDLPGKRRIQNACAVDLRHGLNLSSKRSVRENIVTFVDDHEMGASPWSSANGWGQQTWPCPPEFKSRAYAFILTSPGLPCVYWPDCYDWGFEWIISELIRLRRAAGITPASAWRDLSEGYSGFVYATANRKGEDALIVAIASNYSGPPRRDGEKGWRIALSQPGEWVIWTPEA